MILRYVLLHWYGILFPEMMHNFLPKLLIFFPKMYSRTPLVRPPLLYQKSGLLQRGGLSKGVPLYIKSTKVICLLKVYIDIATLFVFLTNKNCTFIQRYLLLYHYQQS